MWVCLLFGFRAGMVSRAALGIDPAARWRATRRLVIQASSACWLDILWSDQPRPGSRGMALLGRRRRGRPCFVAGLCWSKTR